MNKDLILTVQYSLSITHLVITQFWIKHSHAVAFKCFYCEILWPLSKRRKIGFQDQVSLNAGQKYCRMLQEEHSAILSTFIKLPFVFKIFVLSIFEWPLKTGFTVFPLYNCLFITPFTYNTAHSYGA